MSGNPGTAKSPGTKYEKIESVRKSKSNHKASSETRPPISRSGLSWLLLILIPVITYIGVVKLDYTCIDDTTFIIDHKAYNQDFSNVFTAFRQGLFQPADKSQYDYYRPLFLVDMIVEYHLFGDHATGYHLTNLLFHILTVLLLFLFLKKTGIEETNALVLSLVFAVHPALSMAVAWIPGRNDMILMIFLLAGMIFTIRYIQKAKTVDYGLQLLFLLLALFTKETAVIIPVLAFILCYLVFKVRGKPIVYLVTGWGLAIVFWFLMESVVKQYGNQLPVSQMLESAVGRVPALLQYLGKIFFPFNLSVHPVLEEITIWWGVLAFLLLGALIFWSGSLAKPLTILGITWFLLFTLPVLAVPRAFNDLLYEHRLYIPFVGILLIISQTRLFSTSIDKRYLWIISGILILVMGASSFIRAGYFKSPLDYWSRSVEETPGNAYSKMMMATWTKDEVIQENLFRQARAIDSTMKDINLYLAKIAYRKKQVAEAKRLLNLELNKASSRVPDNYFFLGQVSFDLNDFSSARQHTATGLSLLGKPTSEAYFLIAQSWFMENSYDSAAVYLKRVIELDPMNSQANNNLVFLYLKRGQLQLARTQAELMRDKGLVLPENLAAAITGK